MNTTHAIDLIKMRHARAVAEIAAFTACASKDIAQYGSWSCDWSIGIGQATTEALWAEQEFDALVRHECEKAEAAQAAQAAKAGKEAK